MLRAAHALLTTCLLHSERVCSFQALPTIQSTQGSAICRRCCIMSCSHSCSASSKARCFATRFLAASRVRADAHSCGNREARTRFFAARSAAVIGLSAYCRRNCCAYRVPPVDTLSIVITACCPVSPGAVLSCTICDGRCGVADACPGCTLAVAVQSTASTTLAQDTTTDAAGVRAAEKTAAETDSWCGHKGKASRK